MKMRLNLEKVDVEQKLQAMIGQVANLTDKVINRYSSSMDFKFRVYLIILSIGLLYAVFNFVQQDAFTVSIIYDTNYCRCIVPPRTKKWKHDRR